MNQEAAKNKKKGLTIAGRKAIAGRLFILPWFIGVVCFFVIPFVQGIIFSLCKVTITKNGLSLAFTGISNYVDALFNPDITTQFVNQIEYILPKLAVIILFSLLVAMILSSNFRGRTVARAIFFLPVIISSGVVIFILKTNIMAGVDMTTAKQANYLFRTPDFTQILNSLGLPQTVTNTFDWVSTNLTSLTWKCGVQILLLLAAVNNIPKSSYEVAEIEGATEWEKFWKITFPLVSPTLLVAVIYTVIDSFTDYDNDVMRQIVKQMKDNSYGVSTALAYFYFFCILLIVGIITFIISRYVYYVED